MIAIIHAYSRANAGDGLLVDLTLDRLGRLGISPSNCTLLALDHGSFGDLPSVVKVGTAGRSFDMELVRAVPAGAGTLAGSVHGRLGMGRAAEVFAAADAVVAVGGGYLRAGNPVNWLGTAVNHFPQLRSAARSGRPSIYLPQSVGPLAGPIGSAVRSALRTGVDLVHVRDDRSAAVLSGLPNVRRTPDLAVLDVAERFTNAPRRTAEGPPVLVARGLTEPEDYVQRLRSLAEKCGVLLSGRFRRRASRPRAIAPSMSYRAFPRPGASPRFSLRMIRDRWSPYASTALCRHCWPGAPAVHLGYERKSWGAYQDLGLGEWVHNARRFDPQKVAAQVDELRSDPGRFWAAISGRRASLVEDSERLTQSLRIALGGRS